MNNKRKKSHLFGIPILAVLIFSGCSTSQKVQVWNYKQCSFDGSEPIQTKHGL